MLVPSAYRRPALFAAGVAALLLVAVSITVSSGGAGQGWGAAVTDRLHALPVASLAGRSEVLWTVTAAAVLLMAAAAVVSWRWMSHRGALLVLAAPALTLLASDVVLKPLAGRRLEDGGPYSFPSGHVAAAAAVGITLLVLLLPTGSQVRRDASREVRFLGGLAAVTGPLLVAASVLALRWHDAVDVVGGALLAVPVTLGTALALDAAAVRRRM